MKLHRPSLVDHELDQNPGSGKTTPKPQARKPPTIKPKNPKRPLPKSVVCLLALSPWRFRWAALDFVIVEAQLPLPEGAVGLRLWGYRVPFEKES